MKNTIKKTTRHYSKFIILFSFLFIAFTTGDNRSEYNVPISANSLYAGDLDLDGDIDIIIGHLYHSSTQWSGISILNNINNGYFNFMDSIYLFGGQSGIFIENLNSNPLPEIIGRKEDPVIENEFIAVIYDNNFDSIKYFSMETYVGVEYYAIGDVNYDSYTDILFASNNGQFWGILYNDGTGKFSEPEYYDLSFHPIDISCGDLNNDGREDIVITGYKTEVYFSYPDGFQLSILSTEYISSSEISDFNNDGMNDILTSISLYPSNFTKLKFYENAGNNTFINLESFIFQPICNSYIVTSDFNNDSLPDILFNTRYDTDLIIFYNLGDFQLSEPQFIPLINYGESKRKSYCADFDGNGYNDIVTIRGWGATLPANVNIFFNDGKGNFVEDPVGIIEEEKQKNILSCYPNPFTDKTTITINSGKKEKIKLEIYDIQGKLIKTFIDNKPQAGVYKIIWNGDDLNGKEIQAGIYFLSLTANEKIIQSIKLIKP